MAGLYMHSPPIFDSCIYLEGSNDLFESLLANGSCYKNDNLITTIEGKSLPAAIYYLAYNWYESKQCWKETTYGVELDHNFWGIGPQSILWAVSIFN